MAGVWGRRGITSCKKYSTKSYCTVLLYCTTAVLYCHVLSCTVQAKNNISIGSLQFTLKRSSYYFSKKHLENSYFILVLEVTVITTARVHLPTPTSIRFEVL